MQILSNPNELHRDLRLARRIIRLGCDIPPEVRESIVSMAAHIVKRGRKDGLRVAAGKLLADLMKINLTCEAIDQRDEHHADAMAKGLAEQPINVQVGVIIDEDWYGNAKRLSAPSAPASSDSAPGGV